MLDQQLVISDRNHRTHERQELLKTSSRPSHDFLLRNGEPEGRSASLVVRCPARAAPILNNIYRVSGILEQCQHDLLKPNAIAVDARKVVGRFAEHTRLARTFGG